MKEESEIRIVHFADTHLGYSAYRKIDSDGINLREKDIYKAFVETVNRIVDIRPDIVIHAGDLFDNVRPTNRAISVALEQILRLSKMGIPTIIIAGNHETPKLKGTGHIFKLFEHLENVYPIYNKAERINLEIKGKSIAIHTVPHCRDRDEFMESLESALPDPSADFNILVTHGAVQSVEVFKMGEINEYIIPLSTITKGFDYVALGHYHGFTRIRNNIVYSGSTEKMSFNEINEEKGFVIVELSKSVTTEFVQIPTRKMLEIGPIDCKDLKPREILNTIKDSIAGRDFTGCIVRLLLINIDPSVYKSLDMSSISSMFSKAMHFEVRHSAGKTVDQVISSEVVISDILTEFEKFIDKRNLKDKKEFLALGKKYLQEAEGEDT
ncbi:MAG: exonuclease SbcCD subunit D [Thermoplasmata archaeon]|nr:exonuclease SbcCD subunit D [Thermoplasmata archaeon]